MTESDVRDTDKQSISITEADTAAADTRERPASGWEGYSLAVLHALDD